MKPMTGIGSCTPLPSKRAARIRRRMSERKSRMYRLGFALRSPLHARGLSCQGQGRIRYNPLHSPLW